MIKSITGGKGLVVTGSGTTYVSKSYSSNAHQTGNMMYDMDQQCIKVFDGNSWQTLGMGHASVELDYDSSSLLDWARKKRDEEMIINRLAETNPTIKDLVNQIKDKQEQIKIVQTLIQKETTS